MARKLRVEVEGGLYHAITRGNDRQDIFHSADNYLKFLTLLIKQRRAGVAELSLIAGLDTSNISRRYDGARQKLKTDRKLAYAKDLVEKKYQAKIAESHA